MHVSTVRVPRNSFLSSANIILRPRSMPRSADAAAAVARRKDEGRKGKQVRSVLSTPGYEASFEILGNIVSSL